MSFSSYHPENGRTKDDDEKDWDSQGINWGQVRQEDLSQTQTDVEDPGEISQ